MLKKITEQATVKDNKLQKLEDGLVEQMLTSAKFTMLGRMRKGVQTVQKCENVQSCAKCAKLWKSV